MNTSRITPSIVGIICQSRRMMYAVMGCLLSVPDYRSGARRADSPSRRLRLRPRPDIDVLPFGMQDGMLAIALHPGLRQHVAVAADGKPPRRVRLDHLRHVEVELVALG